MGEWFKTVALKNPKGLTGIILLTLFAIMALSHPVLMALVWNRGIYHPMVGFDPDIVPHPTLPSLKHPLGTDSFGRDILSQLLYGAGTSLGVGIMSGLVASILAVSVGVASAYFGRRVEILLMGLCDVLILLPPPIILLIIGLLVDMRWPTLALLYGILAGLGAPAVILKAWAQNITVRGFVETARLSGGSDFYIIRRHILPYVLPAGFLFMMFTASGSVLTEAFLSFFGRTKIRMSWGSMIWFTQLTFYWSPEGPQWHALFPPALAIILFCSAFYLLGKAVEEYYDPFVRRFTWEARPRF